MLTQIRERASGWIAWVIVILITIPFALWGIQSYFEGPSEISIATVNGEQIPLYAYQNQLARERQALQQQAGENYDPALLNSAAFRAQVIERLISSRLVLQYIDEQNYRLSDARLKQHIQTTSRFLRDGQFDPAIYRARLRASGFTAQSYEALERQNVAINQLISALADSAFVTQQEMEQLLRLQAQTRKTDYVILSANRFESKIKIDAAQIKQHYEDNLSNYQIPARIKVAYIDLSVEELANGIVPSKTDINSLYEQTVGRYQQAEIRKASHILLGVTAQDDEEKRKEALSAAEAVLAKAKSGADFAKLAKQHSDDSGSKDKGGALGVVTRGQMVAAFEDAVFDMTADELRGPIETQFGYHIIKLTELTEQRQKPLAEVREQVATEVRRAQAENLFAERSEAFQNLVFEYPDSLDTAAEELDLEIKQTDWFTAQDGLGLADEAQVRRTAFNEEVLDEDLNSTIELGFDRLVAIRKSDYEAVREKPFKQVKADIEQLLKAQQSAQKTKDLGIKLVSELNSGQQNWKKFLAKEKLQVKSLAETREQVPQKLATLRDSVFANLPPLPGKIIYNGVTFSNGDYVLYALKEVAQGDIESIEKAQRDQLQQQLLARDGNNVYQQLLQTVLNHADVSVNREQLQTPTTSY